jgi:hypothetical protein
MTRKEMITSVEWEENSGLLSTKGTKLIVEVWRSNGDNKIWWNVRDDADAVFHFGKCDSIVEAQHKALEVYYKE